MGLCAWPAIQKGSSELVLCIYQPCGQQIDWGQWCAWVSNYLEKAASRTSPQSPPRSYRGPPEETKGAKTRERRKGSLISRIRATKPYVTASHAPRRRRPSPSAGCATTPNPVHPHQRGTVPGGQYHWAGEAPSVLCQLLHHGPVEPPVALLVPVNEQNKLRLLAANIQL